jgi:pimeloyl-ACP methyl ester carboxylesterase
MEFFSSGGVRIAYIDKMPEAGAGDPVVLLHGFASTHRVNWIDTSWVSTLNRAGYRVIALDHRGHGQSDKLYEPEAYDPEVMAKDVIALLDHLHLAKADLIGYSMGARIAAMAALHFPDRVRSVILGGLGIHLVEGQGLPPGIAEALESQTPETITDPTQKMFRLFAEKNGGDLKALAACMRGSRRGLTAQEVATLTMPVLVAVGSDDKIGGDPERLAALIPQGHAFVIAGRDHNLAVGDRTHKAAALEFLSSGR